MKEVFLHYVWRYGLYTLEKAHPCTVNELEVIHPGQYHQDAGPDFRDARIRMGQAIWAGHVEIHLKGSDWFVHRHDQDPAYNNVILHVVHEDNKQAVTQAGLLVPTVSLRVKEKYYQAYQDLVQTINPIPCHAHWKRLEGIYVDQALSAMGVGRMEDRIRQLEHKLAANKGGWRELFLQVWFRAFGFGKFQNNLEHLAASLPVTLIDKHQSNRFQLESLLFGQAGLLPERSAEPYSRALLTEYRYLARKYNLHPDIRIVWNARRTRPANSPVIRIAQLAGWLSDQKDFFDSILTAGTTHSLSPGQFPVSSYWKNHYDFGCPSSSLVSKLGDSAINLLMINAVYPLRALYRHHNGQQDALADWMDELESRPAEINYIMKQWRAAGFRIPNAFYSQLFLHVYRSYCAYRNCVECRLGQLILRRQV